MASTGEENTVNLQRDRCYSCFRPKRDCFCGAIPVIDNKTAVLILQHRRERFHPFNTARIVAKSLQNSCFLIDHIPGLAARVQLQPHAGLLYPGPGAKLLSDVPPAQRPGQLVVLDGTWHQAKTLLRDIPALHDLPRYRLAPASPSRYRIRREPNALSLSTIEATVAALRVLEPHTVGLDRLLEVFNSMVERQLRYPKSEAGWRFHANRSRTSKHVPLALLQDPDSIVVAYGESAAGGPGRDRVSRYPVFWVAQRLGTGERFACAIQPQFPLDESFLGHLELTHEDFSQALSLAAFREAWAAFHRPGDTLAVYSQSTASLLTSINARFARCLVLKSIDFNPEQRYGTLDEVLRAEGLVSGPAQHPSRAGRRLANAVAFVQHLTVLGNGLTG